MPPARATDDEAASARSGGTSFSTLSSWGNSLDAAKLPLPSVDVALRLRACRLLWQCATARDVPTAAVHALDGARGRTVGGLWCLVRALEHGVHDRRQVAEERVPAVWACVYDCVTLWGTDPPEAHLHAAYRAYAAGVVVVAQALAVHGAWLWTHWDAQPAAAGAWLQRLFAAGAITLTPEEAGADASSPAGPWFPTMPTDVARERADAAAALATSPLGLRLRAREARTSAQTQLVASTAPTRAALHACRRCGERKDIDFVEKPARGDEQSYITYKCRSCGATFRA